MKKVLHILKSEPDETVAGLVEALSDGQGTSVVGIYPDAICGDCLDWSRLVDDIFAYERIICWW